MDPCGLVDKFRDLGLNLIWEQLLYLIYYHRNIDQLNGQLTELNLERIAIQHQIDEAKNNGEQIEEKVLRWLGEVDALSEQVQKFHEEESQAKRECSITSCPNLWLRYKLSKRAKAMTEEGAKIFAKRNLGRVGYPPHLPSNLELTYANGDKYINMMSQIQAQVQQKWEAQRKIWGPNVEEKLEGRKSWKLRDLEDTDSIRRAETVRSGV